MQLIQNKTEKQNVYTLHIDLTWCGLHFGPIKTTTKISPIHSVGWIKCPPAIMCVSQQYACNWKDNKKNVWMAVHNFPFVWYVHCNFSPISRSTCDSVGCRCEQKKCRISEIYFRYLSVGSFGSIRNFRKLLLDFLRSFSGFGDVDVELLGSMALFFRLKIELGNWHWTREKEMKKKHVFWTILDYVVKDKKKSLHPTQRFVVW